MAKRGYKLQEFVAHSGNVNCIKIGKNTGRLFVTGGDDQRVNLWSIGKPTSLTSLCGHSSPVESVTFDSKEGLVLAGASAGVLKLWDLEETKMVRTLTGHRSNCTALEFHPFGEFFVSGSMDTNVMIWDIRKKGCIHTYKGHTRGISTIRFSPDGRWVVSGGLDNVVKIWDLTAGKLLHDFKFHDGHIRSIDFHPLEFLLATGSADRTVKFWDLETFELIGSARPQASGVRSINFHPDGRTLFCGFDDSLKVYSWEPMICHDAVEMGWSTLGDLCIHDGKLLGSSYYQNYVGVWVVDISLVEPYGAGFVPEQNHHLRESKYNLLESPIEKVGGHTRSTSTLRSMSPEYESRDIKTIYVDSEKPVVSRKIGSLKSPKVVLSSDSKNVKKFLSQKQVPEVGMQAKTIGKTNTKSFAVPSVVPRESLDGKDSANSKSPSTGIPRKPLHVRSSSASQLDMERLPMAIELGPFVNMKTAMSPNFRDRVVAGEDARESSEEKQSNIKSVAENFEKVLSPRTPSNVDNGTETLDGSKGINSVKYVNGVAVVQGRTRTLVERFERRDKVNSDEVQTPDTAVRMISETAKASPFQDIHPQISGRESTSNDENVLEDLMQNHDALLSTFRSRLTKLQVVRHFWERNDIKGALNSMRKLPDHSVQADVVTVLMDKMEIFTLDLFSCLLPVLLSLLDSKIERHAHISLEMLLKLVAVFGPVVRSNISSPSAVGVDLQAEQRLECCNQCFIELEKIKTILPALARRSGLIAKFARELNLVLQES